MKGVHDGYIRNNKKTSMSDQQHIWYLIKITFEVITTSGKNITENRLVV